MKNVIRNATIAALLAGLSAGAQARGPDSYERLATLPDTTAAQQDEIHRIENDRRSAHAALFAKERAEHDRIDEQTAQKLRKALGEDGYRKYAEWKLSHSGHRGRMHARGGRADQPRRGMRGGPGMSGGPDLPPAFEEDGDSEEGPNA